MSKTVFFNNPGSEFGGRHFGAFLDNLEPLVVAVDSPGQATYTDHKDFTLVLKGDGFAGDGDGLTGGTVRSATFFNAEGEKLASVRKFSVDAAAFHEALETTPTADVFIDVVLKKKDSFVASDLGDTFFAGKGNDRLLGGEGRDLLGGFKGSDTLTGGGEDDIFLFRRGDGADVITDFDARGSGVGQDFVQLDFDPQGVMKVEKSGRNDTLVDFGKGDSILLEDVRRGDVDIGDFFFF